jgi:hypothetical protein
MSDVPSATAATHRPLPPDEAIVTTPSSHTDDTPHFAKQLFDEEVAVLEAQATIKTFIDVIATRRVKQRLRKLK